jgi:hypothetical protein
VSRLQAMNDVSASVLLDFMVCLLIGVNRLG